MTWQLFRAPFTAENASIIASGCWMLLLFVWIVMGVKMKKVKQRESPWEFLQHAALAFLGFWLIFENTSRWAPLRQTFLPETPAVWGAGLSLTVLGVGIAIWARLSLGGNWSSAVTLKDAHELIRKGLYRWIRHPIYTGILLAAFGTALIKGQLHAWLGFAVLLGQFYFKARREERFLRQEFGPGFDEHARSTGMFLPKFT
jgi:protein-S-isoprenylcysteine O-methyltransferase Ste14